MSIGVHLSIVSLSPIQRIMAEVFMLDWSRVLTYRITGRIEAGEAPTEVVWTILSSLSMHPLTMTLVAADATNVGECHLNGGNVCQGGALFTLADLTFAAAANSHGKLCLGINNQIHYVKSAFLGDHLTAECHEMSSKKIHLLESKVTNQKGELIAMMTGECFMKDVDFEFEGLM